MKMKTHYRKIKLIDNGKIKKVSILSIVYCENELCMNVDIVVKSKEDAINYIKHFISTDMQITAIIYFDDYYKLNSNYYQFTELDIIKYCSELEYEGFEKYQNMDIELHLSTLLNSNVHS